MSRGQAPQWVPVAGDGPGSQLMCTYIINVIIFIYNKYRRINISGSSQNILEV